MDEKSDNKEKGEEKDTEDSQNQDIAGVQNTQEHWPDLASATRIRPSLPRRSKAMHRVVLEIPGNLGKKGNKTLLNDRVLLEYERI